MPVTQYRAEFDATVGFSNGGSLHVESFRVDVPGHDVPEEEVAALFVTSLGLLMTEQVELANLRVFPEAHKGTRGGPSAATDVGASRRFVELNHVINAGLTTYPGIPEPVIRPFLTREDSRSHYAPGTEFALDWLEMVGNTGTYLDTPFHRYPDGHDLGGLPLERIVDLPTVVVRTVGSGRRAVDVGELAAFDVRGAAVLLHTGGDQHFGSPAYAENAPYLTAAGAHWLVDAGAVLVGIDAVNIDSIDDPTRPAHSILLAARISIVEHMTNLRELPPHGARFTATPPRVAQFGTFPVRAFATVPA